MPFFKTTDGLTLHYTDTGTGTPILCLPGLTRSTLDFDYMAPHLSGVRLICLDYRGRGKSDWAVDCHSYSVPQEAKDVLALMTHIGLERAAIIGTSRGGIIAMVLAAMAKQRLAGVFLNDIGPELDPTGWTKIEGYLGKPYSQKTQQDLAHALARAYPEFTDLPPGRWLAEAQNHSVQTEDGLQLTYDPRLRDAVLATFDGPQPDLWPLFDELAGLPLALLRGANSDLLSAETAQKMKERMPNMRLAEVPGRGHIPFLDEPASLTLLREWIADL